MAQNVKFISVALQSTFDALITKDALALYFIQDSQRLYHGDCLMGTGALATGRAAGLLSSEDYAELKKLIAAGPASTLEPVDGSLIISDGKIGVNISKAANNLIAVNSDGLFATIDLQPIEQRLIEIEKQVVGGIHYRGSVPTVDDLPENPAQGDLYEIEADGSEYCWNGEKWFAYGTAHFVPVAKDGIVISNGNEISVKISAAEDNALKFVDGALYVAPGMSSEEKEIFDSIPETYASKTEMEAAIAKAVEDAQPMWEELEDGIVELDGSATDYMQNTAFQRAIKDLADGSTVVLKNGSFRVAFLDEYSVPKSLTVVGGTGATVTEFGLETNVDGLTLRNLNFAEGAHIYGATNQVHTVKNLTIDNCVFEKGFIYLGLATGAALENIVITNCKVNGAVEGFNGVTLHNVNNATISGNTINNSDDIGIALLGNVSGIVDVENNMVAGTGDRALRVNKVNDNAVITYKHNVISGCAVASVEGEGLFKVTSTGVGAFIIFNGNTYDGVAWAPNNIGENANGVVYTIA